FLGLMHHQDSKWALIENRKNVSNFAKHNMSSAEVSNIVNESLISNSLSFKANTRYMTNIKIETACLRSKNFNLMSFIANQMTRVQLQKQAIPISEGYNSKEDPRWKFNVHIRVNHKLILTTELQKVDVYSLAAEDVVFTEFD